MVPSIIHDTYQGKSHNCMHMLCNTSVIIVTILVVAIEYHKYLSQLLVRLLVQIANALAIIII